MGERLRALLDTDALDLPSPGSGRTAQRLQRLAHFGRQDLSVARLVEAHTDAVAILKEAGREPIARKLYGVWASESSAHRLRLDSSGKLHGVKAFCSGAGIVDRALVTVRDPNELLVEVDLQRHASRIAFDAADWIATAFAETNTASVNFDGVPIVAAIGSEGWYLSRPGFWHGACGPAACWSGGAEGLWDYCNAHPRDNAQDVANLGAIYSLVWAARGSLEQAGREIDEGPEDCEAAQRRALALRHHVDHCCTETLLRFAHVYGPRALAFDQAASRRHAELQLYVRQCHGERDLESLGHLLWKAPESNREFPELVPSRSSAKP